MTLDFSALDDPEQPELDEVRWFADEYVLISNITRTQLTLQEYLADHHLVLTPWDDKQGVHDILLARMGYARQITIKTPSLKIFDLCLR